MSKKPYSIYPVSVIDCAKPKYKMRGSQKKNGVTQSSRTEFSPFQTEIGTLCAEFYCRDTFLIYDPFAGWGERHKCCVDASRNYYGIDKSPAAIKYAKEKFNVENHLGDSLEKEIPYHDGLITCPPYWNLEKYEGGGLSSLKSWEEFLIFYKKIFERAAEKAMIGATYCIMVGDWRKKHKFYNLSFETERIMKSLGFETWDKVIVNQKKIYNYLRMGYNAKKFGYSCKVHQYLLIFKKVK
jgi:DNA modification methylase